MQQQVKAFIVQHGLSLSAQARFIDLTSELGELGKALLLAGEYGTQPITATENICEETGDCLFALLALCQALEIDAATALEAALCKYRRRKAETGTVASGGIGGGRL